MKEKLTANILFSGIGCQERGIENTELFDIEILNTSDIDKEAVVSYAAIHCGLTKEIIDTYKDYPSREEMAKYLTEINLGYQPEKNKKFDWYKLAKRKNNDIEKYWIATKMANNLGDISKIKNLPYADLWTISFCCQDISVAGKMKGLKPDSGTRSSLLWENIRLLKTAKENDTLPKYLMFENVKNLVSKKFIDDFNNLLDVLDELGFNSYWEVINGKDCGVPQNRERVFVISIRKDIDTKQFTFPKPFDTGIRLKDILEKTVEDKYYLGKEIQNRFKITDETFTKNIVGTTKPDFRTIGQRDLVYQQNSIMGALVATDYKQPKQIIDTLEIYEKPTIQKMDIPQTVKVRKYPIDCKALCQCLREHKSKNHLSNNKIAEELNVPLTKVEHWFRQDRCFAIPDADIWMQLKTILNIITDEFDKAIMTFEEKEGVYEKSERHYLTNGIAPTLTSFIANEKFIESHLNDDEMYIENMSDKYSFAKKKSKETLQKLKILPNMFNPYNQNEITDTAPTLTTSCDRSCSSATVLIKEPKYKIRKLTPGECFKLMGLTFEDCDKAYNIGVADTHLYKQAGNGIITNCVKLIAEHLYKAQYDNTYVCEDEMYNDSNFIKP